MENELKKKILQSIDNIKQKKSRIYFLVQDTKGNAKASVRYIYDMALTLKKEGFNSIILHEKKDYEGVGKWLSEEYMEQLPHVPIEGQNLEISPEDFIIIPEIYGFVMEQIKNLPCGKIVLAQSYAYIVETLQPGQAWQNYGFYKCITTTEKQKEHIGAIMRSTSFDIITPFIGEEFQPNSKPPMPIIGVHTKDPSHTVNLIKSFYLKFPQYRWFSFRDLRGLSQKQFAKSLSECMLSVWIDDESGFGTFPLESMACNVPCMGKIPNMEPEWMTEDNGLWFDNQLNIIDYIADFIQNWLEDNIKPDLYEGMSKTIGKYQNRAEFENNVIKTFEGYLQTRVKSFEDQIEKTEE